MGKNVKIFLVRAVALNLDEVSLGLEYLISRTGYFTNLKELYSLFESDTIQAYSTISKSLRETGTYRREGVRFDLEMYRHKIFEITISRVLTNRLYEKSDFISLSDVLRKETNGMNKRAFVTF